MDESKEKQQKDTIKSLFEGLIPAFLMILANIIFKKVFPDADKDYIDFFSYILLLLILGLIIFLKKKQTAQRKWLSVFISTIILCLTCTLIYFISYVFNEEPTAYFIVDASENMANNFSEVRPKLKLNALTFPDSTDLGMSVFGGEYTGLSGCDDIVELVPPSSQSTSLPRITDAINSLAELKPRGMGNLQGAVASAIRTLRGRKGLQRIIVITFNPSTDCEPLDSEYIHKLAEENKVELQLIPLTVGDVPESIKQKLEAYATNKIYINTTVEDLPATLQTILNAPPSPYDLYYFGYYGYIPK